MGGRMKGEIAGAVAAALLGTVAVAVLPARVGAQAKADGSLHEVRRALEQLRREREQDRKRIEQIEKQLEAMEKAAAETKAEQKEAVSRADRLLSEVRALRPGSDRFLVTGYGFARYRWSDRTDENTFSAALNPIFLFRPFERVLFEAELEAMLPEEGESEISLEYAQADVELADFAMVAAGKMLLPFGEFIERLHPAWINKLVSHPLPFREPEEGGLLPFTEIGAQLRGGANLGYGPGATLEYAVYVANGPRFESDEVGAPFASNNADLNRGKGYGARVGVQPLPVDSGWGRLRLGASTWDGLWDAAGDHWLTSWGIDAVYQYDIAEVRGEYLFLRRDMPEEEAADRREGWYVQGSYKLSRIGVPHLDRLELVARYSGQNQRAAEGELDPHPRQFAFGVDYWLSPAVVWKIEYDRDMPRDATDSDAIQTQIAVGF